MSEHSMIAEAFDAVARAYDAERRLLIPSFDGFYGNALEVIADWGMPAGARVLDLGAGTGLFSEMVASSYPDASFHLVDISEGMLEEARQRFKHERVAIQVLDLGCDELEPGWDLVVSALAIHHLEDEAKRTLFGRIFNALKPGGLFINAEQVLGPTPPAEARNVRVWHRQIRALGATDEQIERAEERMTFDRMSTVEQQTAWLRDAGFPEVDCTFKSWRFAVIAAWKS